MEKRECFKQLTNKGGFEPVTSYNSHCLNMRNPWQSAGLGSSVVLAIGLVLLSVCAFVLEPVAPALQPAPNMQNAPRDPDRTHTGAVTGKVIDESGKSVAGATVKLTDSVTQEVSTYTSDKYGEYKIVKLSPGAYILQAEADGRQSDVSYVKVNNDTVAKQDLKIGSKK